MARYKEEELLILRTAKNKDDITLPNRSKKSIRRKLMELNLITPVFKIPYHKKKQWTKKEIEILKSASNIRKADLPNRSRQSIVRMASRLGILNRKHFHMPWSKENEELLAKLVKEGKKCGDIFKMNVLPYSKNSIQKKISRLKNKPIVLSSAERLLLKEEEIKKKGGTIKFVEDSIKFARAEIMRERLLRREDIWTGEPLNKEDATDVLNLIN